jgi:hypothetical protein
MPARDDPSPGVDEGVGQDCDGLHAELQPLVEMGAMQHPATNILILGPMS